MSFIALLEKKILFFFMLLT